MVLSAHRIRASLKAMRRNGQIWAVCYFAIIPVWAAMYTWLPDGFYDQSIKVEQSTRADNLQAATQFCTFLRQHLAGENTYLFEINGHRSTLTFSPAGLTCDRLFHVVDGEGPRISVRLSFEGKPRVKNDVIYDGVSQIQGWIDSDITINPSQIAAGPRKIDGPYVASDENLNFDVKSTPYLGPTMHANDAQGNPLGYLRSPRSGPPEAKMQAAFAAFQQYADSMLRYGATYSTIAGVDDAVGQVGPQKITHPILVTDTHVDRYLNQLLREQIGYTSEASGNFPRMLYFSATTVTTLGLGDIAPVSAVARVLVALEAIAGIVCAGMFLNGLSNNAKQSSPRA